MIEKAVIDRFEGDYAVLLVGDAERHFDIPRKSLPRGCKEGIWLKVMIEGESITSIEIDKEETARARERIAEKLARLRRGDHLEDKTNN